MPKTVFEIAIYFDGKKWAYHCKDRLGQVVADGALWDLDSWILCLDLNDRSGMALAVARVGEVHGLHIDTADVGYLCSDGGSGHWCAGDDQASSGYAAAPSSSLIGSPAVQRGPIRTSALDALDDRDVFGFKSVFWIGSDGCVYIHPEQEATHAS